MIKTTPTSKKTAVILFNLGGPDKLSATKKFLFNLFNDKAIINLPFFFRYFLAKYISKKREKFSQEIYKNMGGKSTILEQSNKQAELLEKELNKENSYQVFVSMRYWHPFSSEIIKEIKNFDELILLPLYPQYSTTTTSSSFNDWQKQAKKHNINIPTKKICCYPKEKNFIKAHCELINFAIKKIKNLSDYRILFSAHSLPEKIIKKGDPYQWQITETAQSIMANLKNNIDFQICYQSKIGRLKWLEPSIESALKKAANDKKNIILVPISFVSEHSETLVELDIEYKKIVENLGIKDYIRISTLSYNKNFISALASLCLKKENKDSFYQEKTCPNLFTKCCKLT